MYGANAPYDRFGFGIIEMSIVPRQKIVNTMHGRHGNMQGIVEGFGRQCSFLEKRFGEPNDGLGGRQDWNIG